jgi:hypothetical protein
MDVMEQLRAWGAAHARARSAECTARQCGQVDTGALWREAQSLRERADRLHREIYRGLDRKAGDRPG